jgi:uncharacterized protein YbjQ (UPF0145 family)
MTANLIYFAVLLVIGFGFGQYNERRHYRSIIRREKDLAGLAAIASRFPPEDQLYHQQLVSGNVVVASDYFKSFLASLVNLLGGRVRSYESLLDRGRREAMLRLKEQAQQLNATAVFNIKYETVRVGGRVTTIEVLAYGTALVPVHEAVLTTDTAAVVSG